MELLKSKRFVSAILGVVFMVLVNFIPALSAHQELLTQAALVVIGLLVGGYTAEDIQALRAGSPVAYGKHKSDGK